MNLFHLGIRMRVFELRCLLMINHAALLFYLAICCSKEEKWLEFLFHLYLRIDAWWTVRTALWQSSTPVMTRWLWDFVWELFCLNTWFPSHSPVRYIMFFCFMFNTWLAWWPLLKSPLFLIDHVFALRVGLWTRDSYT